MEADVFGPPAHEDQRGRNDQQRRDDAEYRPRVAPADKDEQGCRDHGYAEFGDAGAQVGDSHGSAAFAHEPLSDRDVDHQGAKECFSGDHERATDEDKLPKILHQAGKQQARAFHEHAEDKDAPAPVAVDP